MKKEVDPAHAEHKHLLDALGNNLKDEVERGLKLLDNCATQIGQARWILVNVNNTIKEFYTDCPVCENNKSKSSALKSKGKDQVKPAVDVPKKESKPESLFTLPSAKVSKPPPPPPVVAKAVPKPVQRAGPRSKTRPNDAPISPISRVSLPKRKTIIVKQTAVKVLLNNIGPYLKGASTVDVNNLNDYDPCTQEKLDDLHFSPIFMRTTSGKVSKYSTGIPKHPPKKTSISPPAKPVGLASKKFMEGLLSKDRSSSPSKKYISRETVSDSDNSSESSDDYKPLIKLKKKSKGEKSDSHSKKKSKHSDHKHKKEKSKPSSEKSKVHPAYADKYSALSAPSSHKPASTRMTITLKSDPDSLFDKLKEKKQASTSDSGSTTKIKTLDFTKRDSSASKSSRHDEAESDEDSIVEKPPSVVKTSKPGPASKKIKDSSSSNSHVSVDMKPAQETKPPEPEESKPAVAVAVRSKPGPASRKKIISEPPPPPPAPSSVISEASHRSEKSHRSEISHRSDAESMNSLPASQEVPVESNGEGEDIKPENDGESTTGKRKLSPDSSTAGPQPETKKLMLDARKLPNALRANLILTLQKAAAIKAKGRPITAEQSGVKIGKTSDNVVTTTTELEAVAKEDKEDDGMELGDDVIEKCFDDLEKVKINTPVSSPTKPQVIKNRPPSFSLSTSPPPTLQDCISPTGVDKFFKGPSSTANEAEESVVESSNAAQISRARDLLKGLSHNRFEDAAALNSQDKITELFAGLERKQVTTERNDLQIDTWYLVQDKILGFADSQNSVKAIQWAKIEDDKFKSILTELETTLAYIR